MVPGRSPGCGRVRTGCRSISALTCTPAARVRAGHALETLPLVRAAFEDGRLSFDKIRAVTKVATPADDEVWTSMALHASGAQLARICCGVRQALDVDDPRRAGDALVHRGVRTWWRDDGMFELMAVLPPEDGAIVAAAIEAAAHVIATQEKQIPSPDRPELAGEHRTPADAPRRCAHSCL